MSLEARSGHKTLLKLFLDNINTTHTKIDDNNLKIDTLNRQIEELTDQIRILVMHNEVLTDNDFRQKNLSK